MATYVLVHGASHGAWCWDLVTPRLREFGHDVIAMDLPVEDPTAGREDYASAVVKAVGRARRVVLVAHSLGALAAPATCARIDVELLVLVAGMIPAPGQTGVQLFDEIRAEQHARGEVAPAHPLVDYFYHDVPPVLAAHAKSRWRSQSVRPLQEPWPRGAWPNIEIRYVLCREDRVLPAWWTRRVVVERLGIVPEEIDGGHSPFLGRPAELGTTLERLRLLQRSP